MCSVNLDFGFRRNDEAPFIRQIDVTFGGDVSLIRLRNAAQNFAFLRRTALNLFRADTSRSSSLPRKIKTAAYNPAYLATAFQLREI